MKCVRYSILALLITCEICATTVGAQEGEWSGYVASESRVFPEDALQAGQKDADVSLVFAPEYDLVFARGSQAISFEGFVRLDAADGERTHVDAKQRRRALHRGDPRSVASTAASGGSGKGKHRQRLAELRGQVVGRIQHGACGP